MHFCYSQTSFQTLEKELHEIQGTAYLCPNTLAWAHFQSDRQILGDWNPLLGSPDLMQFDFEGETRLL